MIRDALRPFVAAGTAFIAFTWTWALFDAATTGIRIERGGATAAAADDGPSIHDLPPHAPVAHAGRPSGRVLRLDGHGALIVRGVEVPRDSFTAECWVKADDVRVKESVFGMTAGGGFEIVWSDPGERPHVPGPRAVLRASESRDRQRAGWVSAPCRELVPPGVWTHVAMTFDGDHLRLFVGGRIVSDAAVFGAFVPSRVPLMIGGDSDPGGNPTDLFHGEIDDVRVSRGVRYTEPFVPGVDPATDADTLLLLTFEDEDEPWRYAARADASAQPMGSAVVVRADERGR